jgi:hypothetical protein
MENYLSTIKQWFKTHLWDVALMLAVGLVGLYSGLWAKDIILDDAMITFWFSLTDLLMSAMALMLSITVVGILLRPPMAAKRINSRIFPNLLVSMYLLK